MFDAFFYRAGSMQKPPYGITSPAIVIRVVDGDSVVVQVRGFEVSLRLENVWAPEVRGKNKRFGNIAKAWMEKRLPVGSPVVVHIATGEGNKITAKLTFGRVVGWIWRRDEDISLNEQIVQAGLATKEKQEWPTTDDNRSSMPSISGNGVNTLAAFATAEKELKQIDSRTCRFRRWCLSVWAWFSVWLRRRL